MLYLLDTNVLITAHNQYYPVDVVPEFWTFLVYKAAAGVLKMPIETFEEVRGGGTDTTKDLLYGWLSQRTVRDAILLDEDVDPVHVRSAIDIGYAPDLTDDELEQIGQDPFLIAHAMASPHDRCVVTTEVSSPAKRRQNRRVPDVCKTLGVPCCDTFAMLRRLQFSTGWDR